MNVAKLSGFLAFDDFLQNQHNFFPRVYLEKMTFTSICFHLIMFKSFKLCFATCYFHFSRSVKDNFLCQNLYGIRAGIPKVYLRSVHKGTCLKMSQKYSETSGLQV